MTDIGRRKWSGNLPGLFINGRVGGSGFRVSAGRVLTDGGPKQGSDGIVVNIEKARGFCNFVRGAMWVERHRVLHYEFNGSKTIENGVRVGFSGRKLVTGGRLGLL